MSLMNDMLRDLEARDARPPLKSVRHAGPARRGRLAAPAFGGIMLLAAGLLALWLVRDVPAVGTAGPERVGAVEAMSDRDRPQTENESPADSAPVAEATQTAGAAADRDRRRTRNESPADSASTPDTTRPLAAVSERARALAQSESPTVSTATPETTQPPPTRQPDSAIVVRPAGQSRDATAQSLASARRALARGQTGVAIGRLQELLNDQPDLAEARILLARTLLASGRPRRAEQLLDDGLARDPENHELAFWLARNRLEQQRPEAALEALEAVSPALAGAPDFHLLHGATLYQLERHSAALETYRRITTAFPGNARAWLGQALSADALGRSDIARIAYRRTLEHGDPRSARLARQRLAALGRASQDID